MKTLHIMQGISACSSLKVAIENLNLKNNHVLCFFDDLALSSLFYENSVEGLKQRQQFWGQLDHFDDYTKKMMDFFNFPIADYDKINLWHSDTASDKLMLYLVCSWLLTKQLNVEVNEIYVPFEQSESQGYDLGWFAFGLASPANLSAFFTLEKPLSQSKIEKYADQWAKWQKSESQLRIVESNVQDGEVLAVSESHFDEDILAVCTSDYQLTAKIIGMVLINVPHPIGDFFWHLRINALIKEKRLIADSHDMKNMRKYSVKLV